MACKIRKSVNAATGSAPTNRSRRVSTRFSRKTASSKVRSVSGTYCSRKLNLPFGAYGGATPRDVVVTITVAVPLPEANMLGLTVHVVPDAANGREQDKFTCELKPLSAATVRAFAKVAVWPALTVCAVVPEAVTEKSGGGVTV